MPMVLNVGGGSKAVAIPDHYDGWEHLLLDIDPKRGVDVVCDARQLAQKFPPSSYDAVYCSHNLEHYYRHDISRVLRGFLHVLTDQGFAEIRVPDIGELIKRMAAASLDIDSEIYKAPVGVITAHDMIYGYGVEIEQSGQDFYAHKTGFSRATLARTILSNGFAEVYFATPLALLELRVLAFKQTATQHWKSRFSLGEKFEPALNARPGQGKSIADHAPAATDPVESLYAQAVAAWDAKHWANAVALAMQALQIDGSPPALHYLLGCCRIELGELQAATADFDSCLALAPIEPLLGQALAKRSICLARINSSVEKRRD